MIEFTLLLPVFVMLVLGVFTGGQSYNQKIGITNAAREGTRYGATLSKAVTGSWADAVRDIVVQRSGGELTNSQVCVALVSGTGGSTSVVSPSSKFLSNGNTSVWPSGGPCFADGSSDSSERVQVAVQRPGQIQALVFTFNLQLKSSAVGRFEATS